MAESSYAQRANNHELRWSVRRAEKWAEQDQGKFYSTRSRRLRRTEVRSKKAQT
jgi:hypothetical protein